MKMPSVETEYYPLAGGLDLVTQRLAMRSGRTRAMLNYVGKLGGGYRRLGGYEPYDGRSRPSQQTYVVLYSTAGFTNLVAGDSVTGGTSGATGKVIEVLAGAGGYIALTRVVGTFTDGENILEAGNVRGVYNDSADPGTMDGFDENRLYALVEAEYRSSIAAIPGEGNVLGVFEYAGSVYGIRNAVGGATAAIYKESAGGWTLIALNEEVAFSNANTSVGEGDTLTQGGVTSVIRRIVLATGTLASGVNTGYLVISGRAGGNYAAGAASSTGGGALTLGGAEAAITLSPSGSYRFVEHNFTGSTATSRIYGCDGVNFGFEFDGTYLARIRTGMTTDKPNYVYVHANQLFYAFGGSVQHAAPGTPYVWSPVMGASEIGMGADVTGFLGVPGSESSGALMILCANRIAILYGTGVSSWKLIPFSDKIGAAGNSAQLVGKLPVFMDALGVTTAAASQNFGGFSAAAITNDISQITTGRADNVVCSLMSRTLSRYMLFYDDMTGLVITFGKRGVECLAPIELSHQVTCAWETTRNGGEMFVGCSDGFVYQLECGRSFAGETIVAYALMAFNHSKSPLTRKQYRRAHLEAIGESAFSLQVSSSIDYDNSEISQADPIAKESSAAGGSWDVSMWDEINYDGAEATSLAVPLRGYGRNISMGAHSESADELPHELQAVMTNYTLRRLERDYV